MAEITRVKPVLPDEDGMDEFKSETTSNRVTKEVDLPIRPGWSRTQRPRSQNTTQVPRFTVPEDGEEVLIKFLDEMPFAPIYQHWVMTDQGRRAYTCAGFDDCPMCMRGDRAKASDWFNIVILGDTPEIKVWIASADPSSAIEDMSTGKRTSPINKQGLYFAVSKKKGTNGFFSYTLLPVKEADLKEEWGVNPLTEGQLAQLDKQKFDSTVVRVHTISELQEAARKFVDTE
jgi:hypothetical protein